MISHIRDMLTYVRDMPSMRDMPSKGATLCKQKDMSIMPTTTPNRCKPYAYYPTPG